MISDTLTKDEINDISALDSKQLSRIDLTDICQKKLYVQLNSEANETTGKAFLRKQRNFPVIINDENLSMKHDAYIDFIAKGNNAFYAMNFEHDRLENKLNKFAINISTNVNELNNAGVGVNQCQMKTSKI